MSTFLDGTTFHSALGFKVGTSICHLGTKKMTEMKHNLAGLKLLIIDEVRLPNIWTRMGLFSFWVLKFISIHTATFEVNMWPS